MRGSTFVRLVAVGAGSLALWLVTASVADAAPRRHHGRAPRNVCDARLAPARIAARAKPFSSTVKRLVRRHVFNVLQRTRIKPLADDEAAIQNGAAVGAHDDLQPLSTLQPLGVLAPRQYALFSHRPVTRRSPRGPPSPLA
jgi:hypothetical protein